VIDVFVVAACKKEERTKEEEKKQTETEMSEMILYRNQQTFPRSAENQKHQQQ
jgi:hypothetical protein